MSVFTRLNLEKIKGVRSPGIKQTVRNNKVSVSSGCPSLRVKFDCITD